MTFSSFQSRLSDRTLRKLDNLHTENVGYRINKALCTCAYPVGRFRNAGVNLWFVTQNYVSLNAPLITTMQIVQTRPKHLEI